MKYILCVIPMLCGALPGQAIHLDGRLPGSSPTPQPVHATIQVSGQVVVRTSLQGNFPVAGAQVEVLQAGVLLASTTTAPDGSYLVALLPAAQPGLYSIRATLQFSDPLTNPDITNYRYGTSQELPSSTSPLSDPIGLALGLNPGMNILLPQPVFFVHGWNGSPTTWEREGVPMLRLDPHQKQMLYGRADRAYLTANANLGNTVDRTFEQIAGDLAAQIDEFRTDVLSQHMAPNVPIDLVAHSAGGVYARAYLNYYAANDSVDRVITFGSPHVGVLMIRYLCPSGCPMTFPVSVLQLHPDHMLGWLPFPDTRGARFILVGSRVSRSTLEPELPLLLYYGFNLGTALAYGQDDGLVSGLSSIFLIYMPGYTVLKIDGTTDEHAQLTLNSQGEPTLTRYLLPYLETVR